MGVFSWKTQDTNKSIPNCFSGKQQFTVYMIDNKGNEWKEKEYGGYGEFGGKDFYELLAEMNGKTTRDEGIDLYFGKKAFLSPNLNQKPGHKWENRAPVDCEFQGHFY